MAWIIVLFFYPAIVCDNGKGSVGGQRVDRRQQGLCGGKRETVDGGGLRGCFFVEQ